MANVALQFDLHPTKKKKKLKLARVTLYTVREVTPR
jgi:hypothetical protein